MNSSLFKEKNPKNVLLIRYFIALLPLIAFGIYRNGINLILNNISYGEVLRLFSFPLIGGVVGLIVDFLKNKKFMFDFNFIIGLIIGMITPYSCNLIIFIIAICLLFLLNKFDVNGNFNYIAVIEILIIVLLCLFGKLDYRTSLEINNDFSYSLFDKFIGFNDGGLFVTSILASLIGFVILYFSEIYKKRIAILAIISYLLILLFNIFLHGFMDTFYLMLNCNNVFAFIFIAPLCLFSPIEKKKITIFGIIVGTVSGIVSIIGLPYEAGLLAILFANIIDFVFSVLRGKKNS